MMYFLFTLLFLLEPSRADAYIDPGAGSYLFQAGIATVVGVIVVMRGFWAATIRRILNCFRKNKKSE